jgi:tetratricopeptide (TPR) repeat protein
MDVVKIWQEEVIIPTYPVGKPEKNPVFLEKRVYQGSSGSVYPYPVIEKIHNEKIDKKYTACFLENEYLKIMILPELGGRVQMAFDKVKQRHFVYYNQVIKPALVGLAGPWISGGIEFNWPQHHRPSTFDPVDFKLEENADGSATVWVNEVERMFRTKGMAGFTLHPGKAFLEIKAQLYNRTTLPQTFLWWANPAVKVNDAYQSVFPPDVNAVYDHGKRDVSDFPIATGTYYKVDYSPGTDISCYKNIPVPTSYMTVNSDYDFVGGYENDSRGGLLHVANHHISPGKKQWTWGDGDFGWAWDRNLTDEDGPYIELMTGVFTDNQPDFSWLQPHEEKSFTQYFMPYSEVGMVKNATKEALVHLSLKEDEIKLIAYTTSLFSNAKLILKAAEDILFETTIDISPTNVFQTSLPAQNKSIYELKLVLKDSAGKILVQYQEETHKEKPMPEAAKPAKIPSEYESVEQLYLTGLHLEQYRHATYNPMDYYTEALRRDENDVRSNNAVGLLLLRKGQFVEAESFFRKAIETLISRNPNPYEGEPYYNLGRCLQLQQRYDEAYSVFYKCCWNAAWQDNGYFGLAQISCLQQRYEEALEEVERSLIRNSHNHKARHLKVALLRQLNKQESAIAYAEESLKIDRFNIGCLYELYLITKEEKWIDTLKQLQRNSLFNYLEYATDYAWAGLYDEAISLLNIGLECPPDLKSSYGPGAKPLALYYMGWFHNLSGNNTVAKEYYTKASAVDGDYCFPNELESVLVLKAAINENPLDAKAQYYLGNFWYAKRQYDQATQCWERSAQLDDSFATVYRNLALAYYNKSNQPDKAVQSLEKAFALDRSDARVLMELDQLYKKLNYKPEKRLEFLEQHLPLVLDRDDLYLERIILYNLLGNFTEAKVLISERIFHPWEGGEGKVTGEYLFCHIELAKLALEESKFEEALKLLAETDSYPHNLGEGKLSGAQENHINYYKGCAYEGLGQSLEAQHYFQMATHGLSKPSQAFFYNDQQPDTIFYQGLALIKLGRQEEANKRFSNLVEYAKEHQNDHIKLDYFAVSLPDLLIFDEDLDIRNKIHCYYLMGLGYTGLQLQKEAKDSLQKVLELNGSHQGVTALVKERRVFIK